MKELVEYIAKSLVNSPDEVRVVQVPSSPREMILELHVAQEDYGKVIGKEGRVAKAMRALLKATGTKQDKHTSLEII